MDPVREVTEDYASSVGEAFKEKQIYTLQHPAYVNFSNDVTEELTRIAERVAAQRSTARRILITSHLDPDESAALVGLYPEFSPVYIPLNKPVHGFLVACQTAANEWCAVMSARYARTSVHYGGSTLSALLRKDTGVHLESNPFDEVMAHRVHSDLVDVHRVFKDYATVQATYNLVVPRVEYDKYLMRERYNRCSQAGHCSHSAGSMIVDGSVSFMSPYQVALGMLQHGADVCHGFFYYHPVMMVQDEGELPGTGVKFERSDKTISFSYPEGRVGAQSYSRAGYAAWLSSHCFAVGENRVWYQLELMKNRGSFMFYRMVKVEPPEGATTFSHALDLPHDDEYSLVESWRLKQGFRSDPDKPSSWERHNFMVRTRVLRRVLQFAMSLLPTNFSRHAVKKQIRVVNNRWVVNGSTVTVSAPLSPGEIESLTTAIFARAFVDRYQSSQLSSEMMSQLKVLTGFHSASFGERVKAVACAVANALLANTLGKADAWLRGLFDRLTVYFGGAMGDKSIFMAPGPDYVTMKSAVGSWRQLLQARGETLYASDSFGLSLPVVEGGTGGTLAALVQRYSKRRSKGIGRVTAEERELHSVVRLMTDVEDTRVSAGETSGVFVQGVARLNELDSATESRYNLEFVRAVRDAGEMVQVFKHAADPDPVHSLNSLYLEAFPAVANQRFEYDTFSLSLDPQDRTLEAPMLRMSTYFGLPPAPRNYYGSKLNALNVPKRQNTAPELLTAINARNLSAPVVSLPQEEDVLVRSVWDSFLDGCCVPTARAELARFQNDPVALAEDALNDWGSKAKPGVVEAITKELEANSKALGDMAVDDYLVMLKADVKPTLSNKPVGEVTAPQVIVYHEKPVSALYSSVFRVLVRRFLSLLKPNYHLNLLKDSKDVGEFIQANHPFGKKNLKFLENDFSKYDKSQSRFVFKLEQHAFEQLGMNTEMLSKWVHGHVECSLRSIALGISLHVMYQRKSGDSTTAFGNGILNLLSVNYAYRGTDVEWAVFIGDDSLICAGDVVADGEAVQVLAEVFNLVAKFYVTEAPYFASNFVVIDDERLTVRLCPDVVKRIERLSMHIAADDPQWTERYVSFCDAMGVFKDEAMVQAMARLVPLRYEVSEGLVRGAVGALGTLVRDQKAFRALWNEHPDVLSG